METQETTQAPAQPQAELTITDLNNLRSVLDVAVRRGAFSAAEASSVGAVFDRLNNFLNAVAPQKPAEPSTQETEAQ